jgi:hypothetical protein
MQELTARKFQKAHPPGNTKLSHFLHFKKVVATGFGPTLPRWPTPQVGSSAG